MAHVVLKYLGTHYQTGWPAADLTDADVTERARERGLSETEYVAEALALQGYYQLAAKGKADYPDAKPAAPEAAPTAEPKRKG